MKQVTVKVADLLRILKENREKHHQDFEAATAAWKAECHTALTGAAQRVWDEGKIDWYGLMREFPQPDSHLDDYDTAIGMLEMHAEATVPLTIEEYGAYVKDQWRWKDEWIGSNSKYLGPRR